MAEWPVRPPLPTSSFTNPIPRRSLRLALLHAPNNPLRPAQNPSTNLSDDLHLPRSINSARLQFWRDQKFLGRGWIESGEKSGERGDWMGRL